jgi:uncharacterized protein YbaR (Trm112 family)
MIDGRILDILACPKCKGDLIYDRDRVILICERCRVYYEVREGIPVLLPDSGKPIEEES